MVLLLLHLIELTVSDVARLSVGAHYPLDHLMLRHYSSQWAKNNCVSSVFFRLIA